VLSLVNDRISLTLSPDYGARVTALTDRATGRQWLVTGGQSRQNGEDTVYGADEAVGWDECFPTVLACSHPGWDHPLRDHGALWGRPWATDTATADCVETRFETPGFRFIRRLALAGAAVWADYQVTNLGTAPLPYLWSQHCLLATNPGDRIILTGHENLRANGEAFLWPNHPRRDLGRVGAKDEGFALKAYSETPQPASAAVTGPEGGLRFDLQGLPAFGLWLCYGGWPAGDPVHQVALEPTTAAADHLAAADALGQARWLGAKKTHTWSVRMTMTDPERRTLQ
jgi:galactose mutarotase-like enzyme